MKDNGLNYEVPADFVLMADMAKTRPWTSQLSEVLGRWMANSPLTLFEECHIIERLPDVKTLEAVFEWRKYYVDYNSKLSKKLDTPLQSISRRKDGARIKHD